MAGFWALANDVSIAVSSNEIIEFTSEGGVHSFRHGKEGTSTWVDMGLPAGFIYDSWVTLSLRLLPNGEFLLAANSLSYQTVTNSASNSVRFGNAILQGHNYDPSDVNTGVTYDIYWDDFTYNDTYSAPCSGYISYTYQYVDCSGLPFYWTYTYTVNYSGALTAPAAGASTVSCPAAATDPG